MHPTSSSETTYPFMTPVYHRIYRVSIHRICRTAWQTQRLYLHDAITEKELDIRGTEHLKTHRGPDTAENELYTTDILRNALNVKSKFSLKKPVEETKLFPLLDEISSTLGKEKRYLIENVDGETVKIPVDTIYSVEAKGHYIRLHTSAGDYEYKKNLSEIAGELMENQPEQAEKFVSTHRSFIVNLAAVERVQRTECILSDGSSVPVSRNTYKSVNEAFIRYYMEHGDMCEK